MELIEPSNTVKMDWKKVTNGLSWKANGRIESQLELPLHLTRLSLACFGTFAVGIVFTTLFNSALMQS